MDKPVNKLNCQPDSSPQAKILRFPESGIRIPFHGKKKYTMWGLQGFKEPRTKK